MASKRLVVRGIFPNEGRRVATMSVPEKLAYIRWQAEILVGFGENIFVPGHEVTYGENFRFKGALVNVQRRLAEVCKEVGQTYYAANLMKAGEQDR